jgi:hypothetical protein
MNINFNPINTLQNDQTEGVQTTDGDTDLNFTDSEFDDLKLAVIAETGSLFVAPDNGFAELVDGARQTNVMTVTSNSGELVDQSIRFTDNGGGTLDGDTSGLFTIDGFEIFLWEDPSDPTIVYGIYNDGVDDRLAFAIEMEVTYAPDLTSATVDLNILTYVAIDHSPGGDPDNSLNLGDNLHIGATDLTGLFDFSDLAATKFLFGVVGSDQGGFIVIGKDPAIDGDGEPINGGGAGDEINTSKGGGEVTIGVNNQHFTADADITDVEQGAYFTYTTGMLAGTYNDADDIMPTTLVDATEARLQVSQTQAQSTVPPGMKITTLDYGTGDFVDGIEFVDDLNPTDHGTGVTMSSLRIYDTTLNSAPLVDLDLTTFVGSISTTIPIYTDATYQVFYDALDSVRIIGLDQKDWVEWETVGTHSRVLVEAVSGKWDIGAFEVDLPTTEHFIIGDKIVIDDDGPTAGILQIGMVTHDETPGVDGDADDQGGALPAEFAALAGTLIGWAESSGAVVDSTGSSFGTDGAGTEVFSLGVSAADVDSGLDTLDGKNILLNLEGDIVVGRVDAAADGDVDSGDAVAFAVSIDGTTGLVRVAQYLAIKHPLIGLNGVNHDDELAIAADALRAIITVTDADDDEATTSTGIGDAVKFQDDGPAVDIATNTSAMLSLDETVDGGDDDNDGDPLATASITAANYLTTNTKSAGTDGEKSDVWSFVDPGGVDSGLVDTATTNSVFLFKEGDDIVGREGTDALDAETGEEVVRWTIDPGDGDADDGKVTVTQKRAIQHDDPTDPDEDDDDGVVSADDPAMLSGSNKIVVNRLVTDNDDDTASSTADLTAIFKFEDDGPSAAVNQIGMVTHDETPGVDDDADDQGGALPAVFAGLTGTLIGWAESSGAVVNSTGSTFGVDGDGGARTSC